MARGKIFICGDGPDSYGYQGHECDRKTCGHYRFEHRKKRGAQTGEIAGSCTIAGCKCRAFKELP